MCQYNALVSLYLIYRPWVGAKTKKSVKLQPLISVRRRSMAEGLDNGVSMAGLTPKWIFNRNLEISTTILCTSILAGLLKCSPPA